MSYYWVGRFDDKVLIIQAGGQRLDEGQLLTGFLVDTPKDILAHVALLINPRPKSDIAGTMLVLGDFVDGFTWSIVGGAGIIGGALCIWLLMAVRRAINPSGHKSLQALKGAGLSLEEVSKSIEPEIRGGSSLRLGYSHRLTSEYLIRMGLGFRVLPLRDLLWAYPVSFTHYLLYFIPTFKTHHICLYFADKIIELPLSRKCSGEIMPKLAAITPWTLLGYSRERQYLWDNKRSELAATVAHRRAQVLDEVVRQSKPSGGPWGYR
ncbi:MAG: DUF6709 family protein [Hyphomicrobiaceae bacterium]|nr:DUF6709 family protein [Hyphomicrobiaceae bacterium]